jgi:hypothetical protein
MKGCLEKAKANPEKRKTGLEEKVGQNGHHGFGGQSGRHKSLSRSIRKSLRKRPQCKLTETVGPIWGLVSSRRVLPTAEETGTGRWWVQEEVGRCLQMDDPPCRLCSIEGTLTSGTRQGRCCTRNT